MVKPPANTAKIFLPKKQGAQQSGKKKSARELAPPSDSYPGLVALISF
jgi:hypothetical protein